MNWIAVSERLPTHGRVLTYSPAYEDARDSTMLYRLMDAEFVRISTEVSHWCIPTRPVDL
jgi:hypothetical protein